MKLKACKDDKVQTQLKSVQKIWNSFDKNIQNVLAKKADKKTFKNIQEQNLPLLKEMNKAVILYVSHSKESVSKRAQAINLSGKERMLTQKMAKELLEKDTKSLQKTAKLFEKSINREKQALKLSSLVNQFMQKKSAQNHIINLSGKQRMLTQKMTKLALLISLNANKKKNMARLLQADKLYDKNLKGFQYGDATLNLQKSTNKKVIAYIKTIQKEWKPFSKNIQTIARSDKKDINALLFIIKNNEKLLSMSNELVQLFKRTETKQTFMEKARANIVDIAGRQRMLTQKMTKEKLLTVVKFDGEKNREKMQKSIALFDTSLQGLIFGDENLRIIKPSNKKISKQLQVVASLWEKLKPLYLKKKIAKKELLTIVEGNPLLLKEMNKAVTLSENVADY